MAASAARATRPWVARPSRVAPQRGALRAAAVAKHRATAPRGWGDTPVQSANQRVFACRPDPLGGLGCHELVSFHLRTRRARCGDHRSGRRRLVRHPSEANRTLALPHGRFLPGTWSQPLMVGSAELLGRRLASVVGESRKQGWRKCRITDATVTQRCVREATHDADTPFICNPPIVTDAHGQC